MLARLGAAWLAVVVAMAPSVASAQGQARQTIIRDEEIESLMRDYANPILAAAGIRSGAVTVTLVGDRGFNAFVIDGRRIFINVGALMEADTPNEIIGVLAHEAGHIAGGHLARLREQLRNAQILSVAGMLLGGAAIAGSARAGDRVGNPGIGAAGIAAGGQEMIRRSLLSYQRGEEQAADRAALNYLERTRQSPRGMITTFKRFGESGLFTSRSIDPYLLSHPLPQERVANLEDTAKKSPFWDTRDLPALQARHDMMRAKLYGFVGRPDEVARRYPLSNGSLAARYARAISAYKNGQLASALTQIDALVAAQPGSAYFQELKGQVLLETGRPREAIAPLRRAVAQSGGSPLIRTLLGHALVATEDPALTAEAVRELTLVTQRDPDATDAFRHLATAYGRRNELAMAELATAQYYLNSGNWRDAKIQASRALPRFSPNSPGALKAQDIIDWRPPVVN